MTFNITQDLNLQVLFNTNWQQLIKILIEIQSDYYKNTCVSWITFCYNID
jgi:hypothetical protein